MRPNKYEGFDQTIGGQDQRDDAVLDQPRAVLDQAAKAAAGGEEPAESEIPVISREGSRLVGERVCGALLQRSKQLLLLLYPTPSLTLLGCFLPRWDYQSLISQLGMSGVTHSSGWV